LSAIVTKAVHAEGDADLPSQAMQHAIDALRDRQRAGAGQAPPPPLEEWRAAFVPGDILHPLPDDVRVSEVNAGGVPAHWLTAREPTPAAFCCSCTAWPRRQPRPGWISCSR